MKTLTIFFVLLTAAVNLSFANEVVQFGPQKLVLFEKSTVQKIDKILKSSAQIENKKEGIKNAILKDKGFCEDASKAYVTRNRNSAQVLKNCLELSQENYIYDDLFSASVEYSSQQELRESLSKMFALYIQM